MSRVSRRTWWNHLYGADFIGMYNPAVELCTKVPKGHGGQAICGGATLPSKGGMKL